MREIGNRKTYNNMKMWLTDKMITIGRVGHII